MRTWVMTWAIVLSSLLGTGCSPFHRAWRQAGKLPPPGPSIEGRWEGTWLSGQNGHSGRLRCLLTHQTNHIYQAWFHAKYRKILSYAYKVDLHLSQEGEACRFWGEEDLGKLAGGLYRYEGKIHGTNFFATYECRFDHGTFQMRRPED